MKIPDMNWSVRNKSKFGEGSLSLPFGVGRGSRRAERGEGHYIAIYILMLVGVLCSTRSSYRTEKCQIICQMEILPVLVRSSTVRVYTRSLELENGFHRSGESLPLL